MRAIEIFRKNGYRQVTRSKTLLRYRLKQKDEYNTMPDYIEFYIGYKEVKSVAFVTNNPEEYEWKGSFSFILKDEMLQAINKQSEEIKEKLSKK